jgi:hypothetical protein
LVPAKHTFPDEWTLRVTDAAVTDLGAGGKRRRRCSPASCFVEGLPASVGGDQYASVVELHETAVADHLHLLARQPSAGFVLRGGEADGALGAHPPCRHRPGQINSFGLVGLGAAGSRRGQPEPLDGRHPPDRLMRPLVVVVAHPHVQLSLGVGERGEHLAVEELATQRLVPTLYLARRGR